MKVCLPPSNPNLNLCVGETIPMPVLSVWIQSGLKIAHGHTCCFIVLWNVFHTMHTDLKFSNCIYKHSVGQSVWNRPIFTYISLMPSSPNNSLRVLYPTATDTNFLQVCRSTDTVVYVTLWVRVCVCVCVCVCVYICTHDALSWSRVFLYKSVSVYTGRKFVCK